MIDEMVTEAIEGMDDDEIENDNVVILVNKIKYIHIIIGSKSNNFVSRTRSLVKKCKFSNFLVF